MGKRLRDGVDVAGELDSIRIVCRIDLREDERTRPGGGKQDFEDLLGRGEWHSRAIVREIPEGKVAGVDGVDIEVDSDGGLRARQGGDSLASHANRVRPDVGVREVGEQGSCSRLVGVGSVGVGRIVAEQNQLVVGKHRLCRTDTRESGVCDAQQVRDSGGVEDPAASALR